MTDAKIQTYNGKLLISENAKLATDDDCCCVDDQCAQCIKDTSPQAYCVTVAGVVDDTCTNCELINGEYIASWSGITVGFRELFSDEDPVCEWRFAYGAGPAVCASGHYEDHFMVLGIGTANGGSNKRIAVLLVLETAGAPPGQNWIIWLFDYATSDPIDCDLADLVLAYHSSYFDNWPYFDACDATSSTATVTTETP